MSTCGRIGIGAALGGCAFLFWLSGSALAAAITVTTTADVVDANDGLCSLREAVQAANTDAASGPAPGECPAGSGTDTITLPAGTTTLDGAHIVVDSDMTIDGGNSAMIEQVSDDRLFWVAHRAPRNSVTFAGLMMTGGNAVAPNATGGAIHSDRANLTLIASSVDDNYAAGSGGGIFIDRGTLTVTDSSVSGNSGRFGAGEGIFSDGGTLAVSGSVISRNRGGGIFSDGGTLAVSGSVISHNRHGIQNERGELTMADSTVERNRMRGVDNVEGDVVVTNSTLAANESGIMTVDGNLTLIDSRLDGSPRPGAYGVQIIRGSATVMSSTIENHHRDRGLGGQGIAVSGASLTVSDTTISNNSSEFDPAGISGGGIFARDAMVTVTASTISNNRANAGGGIAITKGSMTVSGSTVSDNSAGYGGGVHVGEGASLTVSDSAIFGNRAEDIGGGIANGGARTEDNFGGLKTAPPGTVEVTNSTISGNKSRLRVGGGIYNSRAGTLTLVFSTVTANVAWKGAGIGSHATNPTTTTSLSGSVVAGNLGTTDVDRDGGATLDPYVSGGFNVLGVVGDSIGAFEPATGDLVDQSHVGLAPLDDNGGPTLTHGLIGTSVAVDHVNGPVTIGSPPSVDQRGAVRPDGPHLDAGAFEGVVPDPPMCAGLVVTTNMNRNGGDGIGTSGDDVILGTLDRDRINGLGGDDTICGGGGPDDVRGGPGDDVIFGDEGGDTIRGGGGADMIDGGDGPDTILGQGGQDIIFGGAGPDALDGQGAADTIDGGTGSDTINGQNGVDLLTGGPGSDEIKGQTGADVLRGDAGDDTLTGGLGSDTLYGGPGFDRCAGNFGVNDQAEAATCEQTPGVEVLF